jgi:hypothetical protein
MLIGNCHNQKNTASPRSQKVERKREHKFIRVLMSNKTPQTINEKENHWGYRIGTVSAIVATCSLNQVLGCTNLTVRFSYAWTSKYKLLCLQKEYKKALVENYNTFCTIWFHDLWPSDLKTNRNYASSHTIRGCWLLVRSILLQYFIMKP